MLIRIRIYIIKYGLGHRRFCKNMSVTLNNFFIFGAFSYQVHNNGNTIMHFIVYVFQYILIYKKLK